ncbi:hypothetical protein GCM10010971_34370 [Silvimonas amylolytica]|uniref:Uncharacterized protein n=1 Tax=Silvimonas amylolytica TaxID=449663 RepID=A0ABQ2PQQ1_9NEIS|nr:hypothetical protein GCM10010971_34370 [Silvimonas amylolytica]
MVDFAVVTGAGDAIWVVISDPPSGRKKPEQLPQSHRSRPAPTMFDTNVNNGTLNNLDTRVKHKFNDL